MLGFWCFGIWFKGLGLVLGLRIGLGLGLRFMLGIGLGFRVFLGFRCWGVEFFV